MTVEIFTILPPTSVLLTCEADEIILKGEAARAWLALFWAGVAVPHGAQVVGSLVPLPKDISAQRLADEAGIDVTQLDFDRASCRSWRVEQVQ